MSYPDLKYRKRLTTSVDNGLIEAFDKLVEIVDKPKSWLVDEAIEDILKKYDVPYQKTSRRNRP